MMRVVELFIADEVRQAARGDDATRASLFQALIASRRMRPNSMQRAHRRLGRRVEAVHQDRHVRRRVVAHDLVVDEAEGVRRHRIIGSGFIQTLSGQLIRSVRSKPSFWKASIR
jgi:hypothetical protein